MGFEFEFTEGLGLGCNSGFGLMIRNAKDCRSELMEEKARACRSRLACGVKIRVYGASCKGLSIKTKQSRLGDG